METLLDLVRLTFTGIGAFLVQPESLVILFLALAVAWSQYQRVAVLEQELYGLARNRPLPLIWDALIHGVVAGTLVSLVATVAGVGLVQPPGSWYVLLLLWGLALGLSLIHPRFICFSYGTTLLSLSYLLLGWPVVDVPGLTGLVAVLHLAEALLIAVSGDRCATPMVFGRPGPGCRPEPVGGFQLQRFWPVLLVLPIGGLLPPETVGGAMELWPWWPLVRPDPALAGPDVVYLLVPVAAIMGYGDIAISRSPQGQSRRSALRLMVYSVILLGLAIIASHWRPGLWLAALFSALGHEAVIGLGIRSQMQGESWFKRARKGVAVLDVLPGTLAAAAGLRSGSVIVEVDGQPVRSRDDLHNALLEAPAYLRLVYKNDGQLEAVRLPRPEGGLMGLGAILVPEPNDPPLVLLHSGGWRGWLGRLTRRRGGRDRDAA